MRRGHDDEVGHVRSVTIDASYRGLVVNGFDTYLPSFHARATATTPILEESVSMRSLKRSKWCGWLVRLIEQLIDNRTQEGGSRVVHASTTRLHLRASYFC